MNRENYVELVSTDNMPYNLYDNIKGFTTSAMESSN